MSTLFKSYFSVSVVKFEFCILGLMLVLILSQWFINLLVSYNDPVLRRSFLSCSLMVVRPPSHH